MTEAGRKQNGSGTEAHMIHGIIHGVIMEWNRGVIHGVLIQLELFRQARRVHDQGALMREPP